MQVSFRVKNLKGGEASGAVAHDMRKKIPGYVDRTRSGQNAILDGFQPDIPASIASQGERVRARTGKRLRKDANLFLSGILTFSRDARAQVNGSPPDQQAREMARRFADENRVKLLYLVRHSDETTTHYHMMFENITDAGESAKNKLSPPVLSRWQDAAGEVFSTVGIGRGIPKAVRLASGEPVSAVIHRSVRKLHEDLPREIAEKERLLSVIKNDIVGAVDTVPREELETAERERKKLKEQRDLYEKTLEIAYSKIEKLKKFVAWVKTRFPKIIDQYREEIAPPVDPESAEKTSKNFAENRGVVSPPRPPL